MRALTVIALKTPNAIGPNDFFDGGQPMCVVQQRQPNEQRQQAEQRKNGGPTPIGLCKAVLKMEGFEQ